MASSSYQGEASDLQWKLDSKDLPSLRLLGKGLSGFLYETTWRGNRYARKDFPLGSTKRKTSVFEREAQSLFRLHHPNIVKCLGYTVGKSSCALLQEYVPENLQTAIQRRMEEHRKKNSSSSLPTGVMDVDEIKLLFSTSATEEEIGTTAAVDGGSSSRTWNESTAGPFEMRRAVDIISKIAAGMKYLHDHGIAHGDLKSKNVLLSSDAGLEPGPELGGIGDVKVADFGLVETKKRIKLISKRRRHSEVLMWKAPDRFEELLGPVPAGSEDDLFTDSDTESDEEESGSSGDFLTSKLAMADVYSFGLTCAYILRGKLLYPDMSFTQLREQKMRRSLKPKLPSDCPDYLKFVTDSSLESEPSSRPTFFAIVTLIALLPLLPHWKNLMQGATPELPHFTFYYRILYC